MIREIREGQVFKHFKGNYYVVVGFSKDSDNGQFRVEYRNIETGEKWSRPYDEFVGYKETETGQVVRFEDISGFADYNATGNTSIDKKIFDILLNYQIPTHVKGYAYLKEAIKMVYDDSKIMGAVTKRLYPGIAEKYDDAPNRVERSIRHAIELAWYKTKFSIEKPTNSMFITLMAEKLKLEQSA